MSKQSTSNLRNSSVPQGRCILKCTEMPLDVYKILQKQKKLGYCPSFNNQDLDNENNSHDNLPINRKNEIQQSKSNSMIQTNNLTSRSYITDSQNYYVKQSNANFEECIPQEQIINQISTYNFSSRTEKFEEIHQLQFTNQNLQENHYQLPPKNQQSRQNMEYENFLKENFLILFQPLTRALQSYQVILDKIWDIQQVQIIDDNKETVLTLRLNKIIYYEDDQFRIIKTKHDKEKEDEGSKIVFNQYLNQNSYQILYDQSRKVNSSIIDAYATCLNQEDEKFYFSLDSEHRERYHRLYIFTSDFINNCTINDYTMDKDIQQIKWMYLFLEKLNNFKRMQYQFQLIYSKIVFVYNLGGFHWCVAEIQLSSQLIILYDSLQSKYPDKNFEKLMNFIFSQLLKKEIQFQIVHYRDFPKQQDGHSCGYYSCIALKYISDRKVRKQFATKEEIIQELREKLK